MSKSTHYAGFLTRLFAGIVDSIVFYVPFYVIKFMITEDWNTVFETSPMETIISIILWTVYVVWMFVTYSATVGMKACNIRIQKDGGGKITYSDAILRELVSYVSLFALGIGYLVMIFHPKKQTWHDRAAGTVIVHN